MTLFTGAGVALITPYKDDEEKSIDYDAFDRLLEFQIENHIDCILVAGTTGEASTQSDEEQIDLVRHAVKTINHRVPVLAGAGSNDTKHAIKLSRACQEAGADAVLTVTPYYLKTSQDGLVAHFQAISDAIDIPMIIYDIPGRTGQVINVDTLYRISQIKNVTGVKDSTNDFNKAVDTKHLCGDNLDVYSGDDDTCVPLMSLGAKGVISVIANIMPQYMHDMMQACLDGDYPKASQMLADVKPLYDCLFSEPNPIPIKAAAQLMGICTGTVRQPLIPLEGEKLENLKTEMKKFNLI